MNDYLVSDVIAPPLLITDMPMPSKITIGRALYFQLARRVMGRRQFRRWRARYLRRGKK